MSEIPSELLYRDSHEWVRVEDDGTVVVGISDHAQSALGDMEAPENPRRSGRHVQGLVGLPWDLPGGKARAQQEKEPGSDGARGRRPRIRHGTSGSVRSGLRRKDRPGDRYFSVSGALGV